MELIHKLFAGVAMSAVAAFAMLLVTASAAPSADAAIAGISASSTTVNNTTGTSAITIDAAATDTVQILVTLGTVTVSATSCNGAACGAASTIDGTTATAGTGTNIVLDPAGANNDTVVVTYNAPAQSTPGTATITAVAGTSAKSVTITVRGNADSLIFLIGNGASAATGSCAVTTASVLRAQGATTGLINGTLCAEVKDANGTRLLSQPVIFTTDRGTLSASVGTTGGSSTTAITNVVTIGAGTSGTAGTEATITASAAGKSTTAKVKFGGDAASCALSTSPSTVQTGGSAAVNVDVKDSTGGPVADNSTIGGQAQTVAITQVNPGSGTNAAILGSPANVVNGKASGSVIAAIPGPIALGAASVQTAAVSCTGSVTATGTVATPTATGTATGTATPGGPGTISGDKPPASGGGIGLFVFNGGTNAQLVAASGCNAATASFYVTQGGVFVTYVPGTSIGAVNADWMAKFPGGVIPANTPIMGKCA